MTLLLFLLGLIMGGALVLWPWPTLAVLALCVAWGWYVLMRAVKRAREF